jgi:hypothetical protein
MLAKMISEAWENENDKDKPLFIDRDVDLFSHVLNYLRYGSIDLPHYIPKTMFQRELDYYGIAAEDGTVKPMSFIEFSKTNEEELKLSREKCEHHELIRDMLALAVKCHIKHLEGMGQETVGFDSLREVPELYRSYHRNGSELLEKYLDEFFGLTAVYNSDRSGCYLRVSVKK